MPQYKSAFVCTNNSLVEVGKQYQYKESVPTCIYNVTVIEDNSKDTFVHLRLRVDEVVQGEEAGVGTILDFLFAQEFSNIVYAGMARLYDKGGYTKLFK